jgi:hypothetical protein
VFLVTAGTVPGFRRFELEVDPFPRSECAKARQSHGIAPFQLRQDIVNQTVEPVGGDRSREPGLAREPFGYIELLHAGFMLTGDRGCSVSTERQCSRYHFVFNSQQKRTESPHVVIQTGFRLTDLKV